jgi:hypothetical protein
MQKVLLSWGALAIGLCVNSPGSPDVSMNCALSHPSHVTLRPGVALLEFGSNVQVLE